MNKRRMIFTPTPPPAVTSAWMIRSIGTRRGFRCINYR
jgi:hypothetical protein